MSYRLLLEQLVESTSNLCSIVISLFNSNSGNRKPTLAAAVVSKTPPYTKYCVFLLLSSEARCFLERNSSSIMLLLHPVSNSVRNGRPLPFSSSNSTTTSACLLSSRECSLRVMIRLTGNIEPSGAATNCTLGVRFVDRCVFAQFLFKRLQACFASFLNSGVISDLQIDISLSSACPSRHAMYICSSGL